LNTVAAALIFRVCLPVKFARLSTTVLIAAAVLLSTPIVQGAGNPDPNTSPLSPEYHFNPDGSVTLRICYNASCASTERVTFNAEDLAQVTAQLAVCPGRELRDRLQRIRIAIWQMEELAEKYLPQLANDLAVNDKEYGVEGRTDCVDNASNTSTFLHILSDRGELPGWSIASPRVRKRFDFNRVHWTAVVIDQSSGERWSVDSWFRPHGHLPFVMPFKDWRREFPAWEPPFDALNPYPRQSRALCSAMR